MDQQSTRPISAASATITLRNLRLTPEFVLDEVVLEAENLEFTPGEDPSTTRFSSGETQFRGMATEANLNRMIAANIPADAPIKNLKVTLYTGRAQFKGQFVKSVMSLPFTLDAKPILTNGIRLTLDCSGSQVGGIGLPGAVVDIIERVLNEKLSIDLTKSLVPVWLDEVRCEPGRLSMAGKARLNWPVSASAGTPTDAGEPRSAAASR